MKPETALAIAAACDALAAALREEAGQEPETTRRPVAEAAKKHGLSPSTLRELCRSGQVAYTRSGKVRGWMVADKDIEAYFQRRTRPARPTSLREVASH